MPRQSTVHARPIKSKRDFDGATAVVKRLSAEKTQDSAAERRLQLLLQELDKYEETEDDLSEDVPVEYNHSGPRRRWSDDGTE